MYHAGAILLNCRFLYNRWTDFNSVCGRLLGLTPATRRYKAHSYAVNNQEVNTLTGRNTRRDTGRSNRECMSGVLPVFGRIRNSIEDYLNGL